MAELRYAKNIVTDTKPIPAELVEKIRERNKDIKSTIQSTRRSLTYLTPNSTLLL